MEKALLSKEVIIFNLAAKTKEDVIRKIADAMEADGRLLDKTGYVQDVLEREKSSSTAIGFDTATPHAKSVHVKVPTLAFVRLRESIKWDGKENVNMVFQIAVPSPGEGNRHLEILSGIFRRLVHDEFRESLSDAKTEQKIVEILSVF